MYDDPSISSFWTAPVGATSRPFISSGRIVPRVNDRSEPSHRVVDRELLDPAGGEGDPAIRVDNAVASVALEYGEEFRVRASASYLRSVDPRSADAFEDLTPTPPAEALLGEGERRARFPAGRTAVETLLGLDERWVADEGAADARRLGVEEYAVLSGGEILYRSVPDDRSVREVGAVDRKFLSDLRAAVADFRGVAVLPRDPLVAWRDEEAAYELTAGGLRVSSEAEGDDWRWFDLSNLDYVRAIPGRSELAFQWREPRGSLVERAVDRLLGRFRGSPPKRLSVSEETLREVTGTLVRLRRALDYDYRVDERL